MRTPSREPTKATGTHIQPCRLPVEMPLTMAPILQPKASRELYPSKNPATMPMAHCCAVSEGDAGRLVWPAHWLLDAAFAGRAAIHKAPARMPMLVMDVTSMKTELDRASRCMGCPQKALAVGSNAPVA